MIEALNTSAVRGIASRGVVLLTVLMALVAAARIGLIAGFALGALAITIYTLTLRPRRGDFTYAAASAIVIPDWLGFVFTAVFLVMPVWAEPGWPADEPLHPSAYLVWPMALFGIAILFVGWRSESFSLTLTDGEVLLERGLRGWRLPYAEIACVRPWRRDLPKWVRALGPFLLATGNPGSAGALMLARERRGIEFVVGGRKGVVVETDGLMPPEAALLSALTDHDLDLSALGSGFRHTARQHHEDKL